ncbi:DmX-like protein 2 [Babesia sp. Xinjiang]|uniref:DmX-like protein 2 n=1 Tax=Babesia sp. Xinjiang TaxID=462227 RepID=UPI000A2211EA|nr:DmX-like protein 2 [Babesia sp. Xinjiang]ORM41295.1 DmX-like protein 2 [Babesia sp. Xinjiang]
MRRIMRNRKFGQRPAVPNGNVVTYLDIINVETWKVGENTPDAKLAAAILQLTKDRERRGECPSETTIYVFYVNNEREVLKWYSAMRALRLDNGESRSPRRRFTRGGAPSGLWTLQHDSQVINATWNRSTTCKPNKVLVTITNDMIAHVWRVGPSQGLPELLAHIDIGEEVFGTGVTACWIDRNFTITDSIFTDKEYIIFHEVLETTKSAAIVGLDKPGHCDVEVGEYIDTHNSTSSRNGENTRRCSVHKQHFKIFLVQGVQSPNCNVHFHCVLSHVDMALPLFIDDIVSAEVCEHTLKSGVVTIYAQDTMRPNRVTPRCSFQMSRWITTASRSINTIVSEEWHDDMLGSQVAFGVDRFLPPCTITAVNDIGFTVQLLIAPCDLYLKDCNVDVGDTVIGLVGRYICHAYSPLFIEPSEPLDLDRKQNIDDVMLDKFKSKKRVIDVEWMYDNAWFLAFLLYSTGKIELYRAVSYNHAINHRSTIVVPQATRVSAIKILHCKDKVLVGMFVIDNEGDAKFNIYRWSASALMLDSSWPFHELPKVKDLIVAFDVWYEGGPFYLVSPGLLASSDNDTYNAVHVYLIRGSNIEHWLTIADTHLLNVFTGERRQLPSDVIGARYGIDNDKLLCHLGGERVVRAHIADGTEDTLKPLRIYHPKYIMVFLELGMRRFVDELVGDLVEACRTFLSSLAETGFCGSNNSSTYACDCVIIKAKNGEIFTDLNRVLSFRFLQTFATLIHASSAQIFGDVVDDHTSSVDIKEAIPTNELLLYLQHIRLPGLMWEDQIELMHVVERLRPKCGTELFVNTPSYHAPKTSGMDTVTNFLRMSEKMQSKEFDVDDTIDFRLSVEIQDSNEDTALNASMLCPLVRMAQNLLKSADDEEKVHVWRTNDELVSLTLPPKITTDEFCLSRCIDCIKFGNSDEDHLVWAVLYRDDHNLFSTMLSMLPSDDDLSVCQHLLNYMKDVGLGYWLQSPSSLELFCNTLEKGFRKLIAVTDTGCTVNVFDEFGFWSILRGKPLVYGCVLKAKGFGKLGEFLSNDFTEERWINAAVKNAYALIAQKRYLLAAGFLVLSGRVTDAVDVCFQYMDDAQLACIICRLRNHDLQYALNLMKDSRIKDVLEYKTSDKHASTIEVTTVEHLVYYLYMGMRFNRADVKSMIETTKKCADGYRARGMPLAALVINTLDLTNETTMWTPMVAQATLQYLLKDDDRGSYLEECLNILRDFCDERIHKSGSNVSNYGSEPGARKLSALRDSGSDLDILSCEGTVIFPDVEDDTPTSKEAADSFQLYIIHMINRIKERYNLEVTVGYGTTKISLNRGVFDTVWQMPNYFAYLSKLCIGFFEGATSVNGTLMLTLILRAIAESKEDFTSCVMLAIASLIVISCFDRGDTGQIYDACMGQLVVLNSLLNNQGSGAQFLACLLRTVEPLCFGSRGRTLEPQCLNLLNYIENPQKHSFFGMCAGTAVLETLLGVCRNWFYKVAENSDPISQGWIDRLLHSASKYLFCHAKRELVENALDAAGIAYPMLSLRIGLENPVDCKVQDEECHVYDTFFESYVASMYGPEFEKLWRFLQCGLRTASMFGRHLRPTRLCGPRAKNGNTRVVCTEGPPAETTTNTKALPLVMPLASMFSSPHVWNQEYVAAQAKATERNKNGTSCNNTSDMAVLDALRTLRFKSLHSFKGKLISSLYSMVSTTMCGDLKGFTTNAIVGPVLNDFYVMAILNVPGSGKLSSLSEELSQTVDNVVYSNLHNRKSAIPSYALYAKLLRIMYAYCKNHLENMYSMKKVSKFSKLADKLYGYFHTCNEPKDHVIGGPSGGICGHPRWPLYAVVYGENQPGQMPAYNVTLQHPVTLMRGYRDALGDSEHSCDEEIVYDRLTGGRLNTGQGSVFGDLCSVGWTGDMLSVLDRNGWLLVYNTRGMVHMEEEDVDIAIPTIYFRPHYAGTTASWLSEFFIATIGYGVSHDVMTHQVIVIDTKQDEVRCQTSSTLSKLSSSVFNDSMEFGGYGRSDSDHLSRAITEHRQPCLCIWDLVDLHHNNSPKLKVVLANSTNITHSFFNKKKQTLPQVSFTCMLPIPTPNFDPNNASTVEHDIVLFDSLGSMLFFSASAEEITVSCHVHSCPVIKCFFVDGNIVAVSRDGAVSMFKYNGVFCEPTRVFEGTAQTRVDTTDTSSNTSLVTSIGEYLGIKFIDNSSKDSSSNVPAACTDIVDAQIVQNKFLVLTTAAGTTSVTELPC